MNTIAFPMTVLPLAYSDMSCAQSSSIPNSPAPKYPLRILTVDDEPAICEVLELFLSGDGHTVESATDGAQALERFCAKKWDVVLVDRVMPKMTGDVLAEKIKQRDPLMPVVLVSGCPSGASVVGEKHATFDAIVRKPFTLTTLRNGIADALRLHR